MGAHYECSALVEASMRVTRFYATNDGESRFEEIEVPIDQPYTDEFANVYHLSNPFDSPSVRIVEFPRGLTQGWHKAPARQIVFVLSGVLEVGTSDNETRRWGAGEVFIADDVSGKGHTTHVLEGPAHVAFIQLPHTFDCDRWSV
jgi:quercetin dioxygenase-like cupin family protein